MERGGQIVGRHSGWRPDCGDAVAESANCIEARSEKTPAYSSTEVKQLNAYGTPLNRRHSHVAPVQLLLSVARQPTSTQHFSAVRLGAALYADAQMCSQQQAMQQQEPPSPTRMRQAMQPQQAMQ